MMMDMNQEEKHLSIHPMLEEEKDTEMYLTLPLVSANLLRNLTYIGVSKDHYLHNRLLYKSQILLTLSSLCLKIDITCMNLE